MTVKVSVCMITYNHEKFIAQAIESVMMQETNFDYELVIGEDCSTDKTRDICVAYQKKYADKIKLLQHEKNLGMMQNFVHAFHACKGQYVALLDGDDYWTSAQKLQKQADFLDGHPDYAMCFTQTMCFFEDKSHEPIYVPPGTYQNDTLTIEDFLIRGHYIASASVMFRNGLFIAFPDWFLSLKIGDWPLHILNAQHGKIGYIKEPMAAYRVYSGNAYSNLGLTDILLNQIDFYKAINMRLNYKYRVLISEMLARRYQAISLEYFARKDTAKVRRYALESIKSLPLRSYLSKRCLTIWLLAFNAMIYMMFPRPLIKSLGRGKQLLLVGLGIRQIIQFFRVKS